MKGRTALLVVAGTALAMGAGVTMAGAQPASLLGALQPDDPLRGLLTARYDESSLRLRHFERDLLMVQTLTFLVGSLGAGAAALQAVKEPWSREARRATVVFGFAISLATIYRAALHPEEPGTIRERIRALEGARKGLEDALVQLPSDPLQRRVYIIEAFKSFDRGLTHATTHGTTPALASPVAEAPFSLVASAEAGGISSSTPPADDEATLYRAGRAQAATVEQAKARSLEDALLKLMAELPRERGAPEQRQAEAIALRRYVIDNKCEVATRVSYDSATRAFEYQTVLAFPKWLLQPGLVREHVSMYSRPSPVASTGDEASAGQVRGQRTIVLSALPVRATVPVGGRKPEDGRFLFGFTAHRDGDAEPVLTLDRIDVQQDGSVGTAEWRFDVAVADRVVLSLGATSYDDRHSPARPPGGAVDVSLEGLLGQPVEIKVLGSRVASDEGREEPAKE